MIQEDLNDYNRIKNGVNARIWQYDLNTHDIRPVAVLNQTPDVSNAQRGRMGIKWNNRRFRDLW